MTPGLLFVHGWMLDARLWDAVLAALGEDARGAVVLDAGYYGRPLAIPPGAGPFLGVGHSLGVLELLADPPASLVGVVAMDGFACFGRSEDFAQGVPARVLARMRERLAQDTGVLGEFIARAGGQVPDGEPDAPRLVEGLRRLETLDGRASPLPVWRLQAQGDLIATPRLADASFADMRVRERRIRQSTDHLSPLFDPEGCASLIRTALLALA